MLQDLTYFERWCKGLRSITLVTTPSCHAVLNSSNLNTVLLTSCLVLAGGTVLNWFTTVIKEMLKKVMGIWKRMSIHQIVISGVWEGTKFAQMLRSSQYTPKLHVIFCLRDVMTSKTVNFGNPSLLKWTSTVAECISLQCFLSWALPREQVCHWTPDVQKHFQELLIILTCQRSFLSEKGSSYPCFDLSYVWTGPFWYGVQITNPYVKIQIPKQISSSPLAGGCRCFSRWGVLFSLCERTRKAAFLWGGYKLQTIRCSDPLPSCCHSTF